MQTKTYPNLRETDLPKLAAEYAPLWLRPGTVVALHGDLGMGKSAIVRAFIRHVIGADTAVPSPTFTLVQPYETDSVTIYHYDLYRLSSATELTELNWAAATLDGLVFVEWPERTGASLPQHWRIEIIDGDMPDTRNVKIIPPLKIDTAMVLAAGFGKRLRPLTDHIPKPLLKLGDQTMLDHALEHLAAAGITKAVVNTHYLAEQIAQHVKMHPHGLSIQISNEKEVLETGGGVKHAVPLLNTEIFLTANSDVMWRDLPGHIPAIARMLTAWDPNKMDTLLLLADRNRAIGFDGPGDYFIAPNGLLTWRHDKPAAPYVFAGVTIAKANEFAAYSEPQFSQKKIWDLHEAQGRLYGIVHTGDWYHCSTPADFAEVNAALAKVIK
jgi:MurNAc alpha-1-phosphate uridylyltransferase